MYKKLEKCLKSIREKTDFKPEKAVILGSGLGDYAEKIKIEKIVKYTDIEDFPVSTVQGHKGQFVFGYVEDVPVVLMQGRVHYYEGYPMQDVVLPTRLMGMMGAKKNPSDQCSRRSRSIIQTGRLYADHRPHHNSSTKSVNRTEYRRTRNQIPGYERSIQ